MTGHWFVLQPKGCAPRDSYGWLPQIGQHPADSYAQMDALWRGRVTDDNPPRYHFTADPGVIRWLGEHARHRVAVERDGAIVPLEQVELPEWLDQFALVDLYLHGELDEPGRAEEAP